MAVRAPRVLPSRNMNRTAFETPQASSRPWSTPSEFLTFREASRVFACSPGFAEIVRVSIGGAVRVTARVKGGEELFPRAVCHAVGSLEQKLLHGFHRTGPKPGRTGSPFRFVSSTTT